MIITWDYAAPAFIPEYYEQVAMHGATKAGQLFYNTGKRIVSCILDYVADEDYTYRETIGYAIEHKLKQISYFESDDPEGLCDFVRWLT